LKGFLVNENQITNDQKPDSPGSTAAHRRLRGFGLHLAGYFLVMIVLVPLNIWLTPDRLWFALPMVGWGSCLALHAAYAMGLFKVFGK
jgi:hypothetical protein